MTFRLDYRRILTAILKKMILTYPLSYSLVPNMVALDPRERTANPIYPQREIQTIKCREKFERILTVLVSSNKVRAENRHNVLQHLSSILDKVQV